MEQVCRDPATASARKVSARKEALARSKEKKAIQERYKKSVTIQRNKDAFKESTWQVWPQTHLCAFCFKIVDVSGVFQSMILVQSLFVKKKKKMLISGHFEKTRANSELQNFFSKIKNLAIKTNF